MSPGHKITPHKAVSVARHTLTLWLCVLVALLPGQVFAGDPVDALRCSAALANPTATPEPGFGAQIRLLSWNIQKAENPGWDADLGKLGVDRDLLLIQEATTAAAITDVLPFAMYQAFAPGYTTETQTSGVLTLSRVKPIVQCDLTAWEPWLGTPKATSIAEYPLSGSKRRLVVINLHAVNFTVGMEDFADQIATLMPILNRHRGPMVIGGDFNTWSEARRSHLENFMAKADFTAVDFSPDHRSTFFNLPLDHVYLRGLRATEAKAIPLDSSDHNPLLVTLQINE